MLRSARKSVRAISGETSDNLMASMGVYVVSLGALATLQATEFAEFSQAQLIGQTVYGLHRFVFLQHAALSAVESVFSGKRSLHLLGVTALATAVLWPISQVASLAWLLSSSLVIRDTMRYSAALRGKPSRSIRVSFLQVAAFALALMFTSSPLGLIAAWSLIELSGALLVAVSMRLVPSKGSRQRWDRLSASMAIEAGLSSGAYGLTMTLLAVIAPANVFAQIRTAQLLLRPASTLLDASIVPLARSASVAKLRHTPGYYVLLTSVLALVGTLVFPPTTQALSGLFNAGEVVSGVVIIFGFQTLFRLHLTLQLLELRKVRALTATVMCRLAGLMGYGVLLALVWYFNIEAIAIALTIALIELVQLLLASHISRRSEGIEENRIVPMNGSEIS